MLNNKRLSLLIPIVITFAGLGLILYFGWPYLHLFKDPDLAREFIADKGSWGPLIFILMQIAQVFLAPIPGQVVGLIGGYLFGPWLGSLYMMIGALIGFSLILGFSRKFGRPFVELFVSPKMLDRFDHFTQEKGPFVFFLIFLLPGFPDDIVSYIAGLTRIKVRTLLLITVGGRMPGYIALNLTGDGLASRNTDMVIALAGGLIILAVLAVWQRKWLHEFVVHRDRLSLLRETWRASRRKIIISLIIIVVLYVIYFQLATAVVQLWPL